MLDIVRQCKTGKIAINYHLDKSRPHTEEYLIELDIFLDNQNWSANKSFKTHFV